MPSDVDPCGMLHTAMAGRGHADYAPCSVADRAGATTTALGQCTRSRSLCRPYAVFPGISQAAWPRPCGAVLVSV
jgi:hypothetical protein